MATAAAATRSNIIGVLATPGTVRREYTQSLIHTYAYHCRVLLHGAPRLAELAERKLRGEAPDADELRTEISPVFRRFKPTNMIPDYKGVGFHPGAIKFYKEVGLWKKG